MRQNLNFSSTYTFYVNIRQFTPTIDLACQLVLCLYFDNHIVSLYQLNDCSCECRHSKRALSSLNYSCKVFYTISIVNYKELRSILLSCVELIVCKRHICSTCSCRLIPGYNQFVIYIQCTNIQRLRWNCISNNYLSR